MKPDLAILYEHPDLVRAAVRGAGPARRALRGDPAVRPQLRSRLDRHPGAGRAEPGRHVGLPARGRARHLLRRGLLAHWAANGARVLNGAEVIAVDSLQGAAALADLAGSATPCRRPGSSTAARICSRRPRTMRLPLLVKANIGGSGAGIVRYDERGRAGGRGRRRHRAGERRQRPAGPGLRAGARRHDRPGRDARRHASSTRSRWRAAATASTCARPTPASPQPGRAAVRMTAVDAAAPS